MNFVVRGMCESAERKPGREITSGESSAVSVGEAEHEVCRVTRGGE